jgi:carnitine O-acetyltransferase
VTGADPKARKSTFKRIYASQEAAGAPVGILTGINRDTWADARAHLLEMSPTNVKTLSAIEAASFVVSLDDAKPSSAADGAADFSKELFYGNGESRWYDKPLQWVVFDSGEAGFIGEVSSRLQVNLGATLTKE